MAASGTGDPWTGERLVRLLVVGGLTYWCYAIFRPFLMPIVWGGVLAVALQPLYLRLERAVGGRRKTAAAILAVLGLGVVLVPALALSGSVLDGARAISAVVESDELKIPPAPDRIADWPVVGPTIHQTWSLASTSLEAAMKPFLPQMRAFGLWLVALAKQGILAVLMTLVAILIACAFLAKREGATGAVVAIGRRIAGENGEEIVRLAGRTIGTVAKGVVGVAAIQAGLAALGLVVAGVPGAGLWSLLILVLAVAQLPPLLILIPAILYLVATDASMTTVVLFSVWSLFVGVSDAILKPLLMGRGSETPVWVILVGAIGGLILHGLIGLFVGAVVFSTGHRLFRGWVAA